MSASLALVAFLCVPFLPTQDSPVPESGSADARVLPLQVADVVRLVRANAPAVRQAYLSALTGAGSIQSAEGAFDPIFFAEATYTYSESPSGGGFLSGGVDNTKIREWRANQGLRTALMTGASVEVSLNEVYREDNRPSGFFGLNPRSDVGFNASVSQPLLRGGWLLAGTADLRRAELGWDRGVASVRSATVDAVQRGIDAYWDLAFTIEDVKVKQFSLTLAQELREVTRSKYRAGAVAEVELVQTEADIASRRDALLTAENRVRQAEDALRALIFDFEDAEDWQLVLQPVSEPPPPAPSDLVWEQALLVARKHRPELHELAVDVERARLDWEVSESNLRPKLDLNASGNSLGVDSQVAGAFDPIFSFLSAGYSAGLGFEVPLGTRAARGAEGAARANFQLAVRTLRDREREIANQVRDAVRNLDYLAERVLVTVTAREVAERQLQAEQRRLQEGASTNFQVLQFQEDLIEALTSEKNARLEYAKAVSRLFLVQGLDWTGGAAEASALPADPDQVDPSALAEPSR